MYDEVVLLSVHFVTYTFVINIRLFSVTKIETSHENANKILFKMQKIIVCYSKAI